MGIAAAPSVEEGAPPWQPEPLADSALPSPCRVGLDQSSEQIGLEVPLTLC